MEDRQKDINIKAIFDFLRATPLIYIGLGFVLTSAYFASIGYFPQNDINSFISIFLYIIISAIIILGVIPFLSYLAIVLWVRNTYSDPNISQYIIPQDEIEPACLISFSKKTANLRRTKKITHKILKRYFLSILLPTAIILVFQYIYPLPAVISVMLGITILIASISLICTPQFSWDTSSKNQETIKKHVSNTNAKKTKFHRISFSIKYITNTLASSLTLSLAILLLLVISPSRDLPYCIFSSIIVITLSAAWFGYAIESEHQQKAHITLFLFYIATILILTQGKIIKTIITHAKLGSFKTNISVDYDTCAMFSALGKNVNCNKTGATIIQGVNIEWRGTDQYITFNDDIKTKNGTTTPHYLIIPSSEIHGMGS